MESKILKTFDYQKPTEKSMQVITKFRQNISNFYESVINDLPDSREKSVFVTKLEEASMWGIKSVVHNQNED